MAARLTATPKTMCGIAGIIGLKLPAEHFHQRAVAMRERLSHRGPDDQGLFVDGNCALAHTRLSILDLSPAGHQPMSTPDGRYTIVFNGEIYNYQTIRSQLLQQGVRLDSDSDTEVILRLYQRHGKDCLKELDGMFAFAIWDRDDRRCFLARDPLGIKPLYIWQYKSQFAFASEIRSLLQADLGPRRLSQVGLAEYLLHGSVQEPSTLVEGIETLPAGHSMCWSGSGGGPSVSEPYWDICFGKSEMRNAEASVLTRQALQESIGRHFVSDVPVGIFLSGGIDSTAILSLARENGNENLDTFCIGFNNAGFDEADLAQRTAEHFGTRHRRWTITAEDGRDLLDGFLNSIDQPSNDGFNTYCVSKMASDAGLKVVLSGLGGDELFGGYPSFSRIPELAKWAKLALWFGPLRHAVSRTGQFQRLPFKVRRLATLMASKCGYSAAYWTMRGFFTPNETAILVAHYSGTRFDGNVADLLDVDLPPQPHEKDLVSYLEMTRYMRNQLLRDSDVMSMAHGLELRVPLVDRKLIDVVSRVPSHIRHASGKRLLLDAVPEVPDWIANQPKRGFQFPFEDWIASQWSGVFSAIDSWSPIRLETWYRRWALLTLHHFLRENNIETRTRLP